MTVVIGTSIFRDRMVAMNIPRTITTYHPFGRPLGPPHDRDTQRRVILAALHLLESATQGGVMVDLTDAYHPLLPRK